MCRSLRAIGSHTCVARSGSTPPSKHPKTHDTPEILSKPVNTSERDYRARNDAPSFPKLRQRIIIEEDCPRTAAEERNIPEIHVDKHMFMGGEIVEKHAGARDREGG